MTGAVQAMMAGRMASAPVNPGPDPTPVPVDPLQVSLSRTFVSRSSNLADITTASVSATITGGTAPFTTKWEMEESGGILPTSPDTPSTAFSIRGASFDIYTAVAVLSVSDAAGRSIQSSQVSIIITRTKTGTGGVSEQ